jgi:hypothetical protein
MLLLDNPEDDVSWRHEQSQERATTTVVIPGRASWREPGIHQAAGVSGEMDSGLVLRTPRNDRE